MPLADAVRQLSDDHRNFGRLLDLLGRELELVRTERSADFELIADIMQYMTHYPDLVHHPTENLLCRLLMEHHSDLAPLAARIATEHRDLAAAGGRFLETVRYVVDGALASRETLLDEGRRYAEALHRHMDWEETEMLPRVLSTLGDAERSAIASTLEATVDPLFGPVLDDEYRQLWDHINRQI